MNAIYAASFFDGHSSKPMQVYVEWHSWGFEIIEQQNSNNKTKWQKENFDLVEYHNNLIILRYGNQFPKQQLDITDVDFIKRYGKEYAINPIKKLKLQSSGFIIAALVSVAGLAILGYFYGLPAVADYGASIFPKTYEIQLGNEIKQQFLAEEEVDSATSKLVNDFFNQLDVNTTYPIKITVVNSPVVNAFALPGGQIIVYTGILKKIKSANALAALLLHEHAHVAYRHSTKNLFRSVAGYLFISVIFTDINGISSVLIENGNQLRNLSYTRELEQQADDEAMLVLKNKAMGLSGMIDLFELLKTESHGVEINELLSTHPDLDARIKRVMAYKKDNPFLVNHNPKLAEVFAAIQSNCKDVSE